MSDIIIPQNEEVQEEREELKYEATEKDEEVFFLMYHVKLQPSEIEAMSDDYRKWLIARFAAQKEMERDGKRSYGKTQNNVSNRK